MEAVFSLFHLPKIVYEAYFKACYTRDMNIFDQIIQAIHGFLQVIIDIFTTFLHAIVEFFQKIFSIF